MWQSKIHRIPQPKEEKKYPWILELKTIIDLVESGNDIFISDFSTFTSGFAKVNHGKDKVIKLPIQTLTDFVEGLHNLKRIAEYELKELL